MVYPITDDTIYGRKTSISPVIEVRCVVYQIPSQSPGWGKIESEIPDPLLPNKVSNPRAGRHSIFRDEIDSATICNEVDQLLVRYIGIELDGGTHDISKLKSELVARWSVSDQNR